MLSPTRRSVSAVIAVDAALSAAVDLADEAPVGISMSAGWNAAAITFQISTDGVTFTDLFDSGGTEVAISSANVAAGRYISFTALLSNSFRGSRYIKIRSGVTALPVDQTAARTLGVQLRQLA